MGVIKDEPVIYANIKKDGLFIGEEKVRGISGDVTDVTLGHSPGSREHKVKPYDYMRLVLSDVNGEGEPERFHLKLRLRAAYTESIINSLVGIADRGIGRRVTIIIYQVDGYNRSMVQENGQKAPWHYIPKSDGPGLVGVPADIATGVYDDNEKMIYNKTARWDFWKEQVKTILIPYFGGKDDLDKGAGDKWTKEELIKKMTARAKECDAHNIKEMWELAKTFVEDNYPDYYEDVYKVWEGRAKQFAVVLIPPSKRPEPVKEADDGDDLPF